VWYNPVEFDSVISSMGTTTIQNRKLAALACLMAFLLFNAVSVVHTHHSASDACRGLASVSQSGADYCIACDLLVNGTGHTTLTPAYVISACRSAASAVPATVSILRDATVLSSSSRAPPTA
jgi:hypothetical protein